MRWISTLCTPFIALIPFSLFHWNFGGFAVYAPYALVFTGLLAIFRVRLSNVAKTDALLFVFLAIMAVATLRRPELAPDLLKAIMLMLYIAAIRFCIETNEINFWRWLDFSILVLVFYGVIQYVGYLTGRDVFVYGLHDLAGYEGFGGPIDFRGGIARVSSLTKEPSHFAYIVGIYLFVTKTFLIRVACVVGLALSFSLITVYVAIGISLYWLLSKVRYGYVLFALIITTAHVALASNMYIVDDMFLPTFVSRYAGISYLLEHGTLFDWVFGVSWIPDEIDLARPSSNTGSVLLQFGLLGWGILLWVAFRFTKNGFAYASIVWILFSFNYYYFTAWPIAFTFIAIFSMQGKRILTGSVVSPGQRDVAKMKQTIRCA